MTYSIIIPTYNGASFVKFAIESALNQTRKADEIIISDDNSIDNTIDICKQYEDKIKIFINENGPSGFVNGWNNAIAHASSDYIALLHQDDILKPEFLEEIDNAVKTYPNIKHFFVPCNYIDSEGKSIVEPTYCDGNIHKYTGKEYVKAYQTIGRPALIHIHRCPGVVTHKDIFKICKYNKLAGHIADDDFFYRVGQYTDVIGILKPLASYRLHVKSETGHLENYKLVSRLAKDYQFQVKQWYNSDFIKGESYEYFIKYAQRFAFEEILFGIKLYNKSLYEQGIKDWSEVKNLGSYISFKSKVFLLLQRLLGFHLSNFIIKIFYNKKL